MEIRFKSSFIRMFRKLSLDQQAQVDRALHFFRKDPFDPRLGNHKLAGSHKGIRSIIAGYDLRILYVERGGHAIVFLVAVGKHDVVY